MAVEARMIVKEKVQYAPGSPTTVHYDDETSEEVVTQQHDIVMEVDVNADDDATKKWSVWTPSGDMRLTIMNPEAAKYFEPGQDYRVIIQKRQPQQSRGADTHTNSGSAGEVSVDYDS